MVSPGVSLTPKSGLTRRKKDSHLRRHAPRCGVAEIVVGENDEIEPGDIAGVGEVIPDRALAVGKLGVAVNIAPINMVLGQRRECRQKRGRQHAAETDRWTPPIHAFA